MYEPEAGLGKFLNPRPANQDLGWLRVRGAASYLGISKATLYRKIKAGHLPKPQKSSDGISRFRVADLDAYATGQDDGRANASKNADPQSSPSSSC